MMKRSRWKRICAACLLCAALVIASPAQTFRTLINFLGGNGANPGPPLVQGVDGDFYGTTAEGGATYDGTIFKITKAGTLTTLYNFCIHSPCYDGQAPAGMVLGRDRSFYGTTALGGTGGSGTVFKINAGGTLTTLYNFCTRANCDDGVNPDGVLIQAADGDFYGTTYAGGTNNYGTVFKISVQGTLTTLRSFTFADGAWPHAGLVQGADGNFYGTTPQGGSTNRGTVFKITPKGALVVLHSFAGTDGANPEAVLIQAANGGFYGATSVGGARDGGTVFKITSSGKLTVLHSFDSNDGALLQTGLLQATDGNLYGTTVAGGPDNVGTVFKITPTGKVKTLHNFTSYDGAYPGGPLVQATNGILYGTTAVGGTINDGTIFSLSLGLGPFVGLQRHSGKVGQSVGILGQGFIGTTGVSFNETPASFNIVSDAFLNATVPAGATTGYVTVTTPSGKLKSNVPFRVMR
jgi:uncharacterized repeat protein (TIGR03803 family)